MATSEEHICSTDPVGYLHHAYDVENGVPKEKVITFAMEAVSKFAAKYCKEGGKLIDIGSGPVIIHATTLSKYYDQIYMAEYQEKGRSLIKNWLKGEQMGDFDWTPYFKLIATYEGNDDFKSLETRVRSSIKDVLPCDINQPKCAIPPEYQSTQFDVVVCLGVIGVNSDSLGDYKKALGNVVSLLKPGGLFIYDDIVNGDDGGCEGHGHDGGHEGHGHSHGEHEGHGHSHGEHEGHGQSHGEHDGHGHDDDEGHGLGLKEMDVKKELTDAGLKIHEWVTSKGISDWSGWYEFLSVCQK